MSINKSNLNIIGKVLTLGCLCFIVISLMGEDTAILKLLESAEVKRVSLIIMSVFSLLVFLNAYIWKNLLVSVSKESIRYSVAVRIYVKANIYKYLPGNVMHLVGRNLISSIYDMKHSDVIVATVLELLSAITASILIVWFFFNRNLKELLQIRSSIPNETRYVIFVLAILIVLIGGFLLNKNFKKISIVMDKDLVLAISVQFFKTLLLHIAILLVSGMCYAFLLEAMFFDSMISVEYSGFIAAYIAAWFFGFITPGSPGGLGVREAVLIIILGSTYSRDTIIVSTVLIRLITVFADLGAYGFLEVSKSIHSFIHKRIELKD